MTLYINACVRKESRTEYIAKQVLLKENESFVELKLDEVSFPKTNEEFINMRNKLISIGEYDNHIFDLAKQFAKADNIVIAAPFWDLSFPASLKQYFEQINVIGITFRYNNQGIPEGLCKAKKLIYITTAGGEFFPEEFGFGYIKALVQNFYGIKDVKLIKATGLDIDGANVDSILQNTLEALNERT